MAGFRTSSKGRATLGKVEKMRMKDVRNAHTKILPFRGEWLDFLGEPEPNFFMNLSGQPGFGKSTFCIKFGNYLAQNFGNTAYFTNEENAPRVKRKLDMVEEDLADNYDCFFNVGTYDLVRHLIVSNHYSFVFIDSVQGGGMDDKELWELHCDFPNIAIIAISRETKDGKARGSQNKEYDGDITVRFLRRGTAVTVKNRFGEAGKEMVLFEEWAKKDVDA